MELYMIINKIMQCVNYANQSTVINRNYNQMQTAAQNALEEV